MPQFQLPLPILRELSPIAAKLYLLLTSLVDPESLYPRICISHDRLAKLANLSPRACRRATTELRALTLIEALPRHPRLPHAYRIHFSTDSLRPPQATQSLRPVP